jgi:putative phage-type endonuclease
MLTKKQKNLHDKYITGSKMAAILGLSPWESKLSLYLKMKGIISNDQIGSERMKIGSFFEHAIAKYAEHTFGWKLKKGPVHGKRHKEHKFLWGLIDRFKINSYNKKEAIIEIKNLSANKEYEWDTSGPPEYYKAQLYFYMSLWGLPGVFLCCFGGNKIKYYPLYQNETVQNFIIEKAIEFWDDLQNNIIPDPDGSEASRNAVNRMFKTIEDTEIKGDESDLNCILKACKLKKIEKSTKESRVRAENELKLKIGEHKGIYIANGIYAKWSKNKQRFIVKGV